MFYKKKSTKSEMKHLTVLLLTLLLINSCNTGNQNRYTFDDFSIEVPSYMKKETGRNIDAVAEFIVDTLKNNKHMLDVAVYTDDFVYKNNEKLTLKQYYDFVANNILSETLESGSLSSATNTNICGNKAMIFEITGKYKKDNYSADYFFMSAVIETEKCYYEITTWTPLEFKQELSPVMKNIILSFSTSALE